ncbi:hypothetical protein D3C80_1448800 [compost metagenome]
MIACSKGSLAIDSNAWRSPTNTTTATIRITKNLANALSNSVKACIENMRLIPDSGFMRLNFGCSRLPENTKPPSAIGATNEITNSKISTGCTAQIAILPEASRNAPIDRSSTMISRVRLKFMRIRFSSVSARCPPNISRPPAPASVTATVFSSLERATSPFSRASRLRFSVGSSVLS